LKVSALTRHVLRASGLAGAVVLVIALFAGMVRLLPWMLAPELPWGVVWPFAQALAAVALETSLLVGVPTGAALGAAELVQRGEARALFALGASPATLARSLLVPLAVVAIVSAGATLAWQPSTDRPGTFAQTLIEEGYGGCDEQRAPSVGVPVVGVTWLCFGGGGAQRLAGPVPKTAGRAWYTARSLEVSDDLRVFRARGVTLATRPEPNRPHLKLSVDRAEIRGMPGWGRGAPLGVDLRAALVAAWLVLMSAAAAWVVLYLAMGRVSALLIGTLPALAALRALHALPPGSGPLDAALGVLGVGIGVLAAGLASPRLLRFLRVLVARTGASLGGAPQ